MVSYKLTGPSICSCRCDYLLKELTCRKGEDDAKLFSPTLISCRSATRSTRGCVQGAKSLPGRAPIFKMWYICRPLPGGAIGPALKRGGETPAWTLFMFTSDIAAAGRRDVLHIPWPLWLTGLLSERQKKPSIWFVHPCVCISVVWHVVLLCLMDTWPLIALYGPGGGLTLMMVMKRRR